MKRYCTAAAVALASLLTLSASAAIITMSGARCFDCGSAPPAGDEITTFDLTSGAGGAQPFMLGHGFAAGDVPSGSDIVSDTSGVTLRAICKREWNDGSCKHAVLVGSVTTTADVAKTITLKTGTATGGTALTCSDIQSAAPSASVQVGSVGTVNLSSLLGSAFRTWVSTPEMVECHYRSAVGSDADLAVWYHVRLWADDRVWVRAIVENGYLNGSPTTETHTVTISIGGSTKLNQSVTQYAWTRYDVTGWIGTDPEITVAHDVQYLIDTLLVPNYSHRSPSSTTLNGLTQSYAVMDPGPFPDSIGSGGASAFIGLIPQWDALCVTTADPRPCTAADVATRSMGVFSMFRRSSTTNLTPRPSDFTTSAYGDPGDGGNCAGFHGDIANSTYTWDVAHAPNQGFLSYLRTGDFFYYETLAASAQAYYFCRGTSGNGLNRTMRGYQNRAVGWGKNIVGGFVAIAPLEGASAADANVVTDFRAWLANVVSDFESSIDTAGQNQIGIVYAYSTGAWDDAGTFPQWMYNFDVASTARLIDIQALTDSTDANSLLQYMAKFPVGLLGPPGSSNYHYSRGGSYGVFVDPTTSGTDFDPDTANFYDSWGDVWTGTHGSANSETTNTLQGSSGSNPAIADGYWMNLNIGIVAAVDHGATGADAAYARLTGATNWPPAGVGSNNCHDFPNYCVAPR